MRKHLFASPSFKIVLAVFISSACFFGIFFKIGGQKVLIISHQETNEIYLKVDVEAGSTLTYKWIHSFEHIPWTEDFEILENNHLMLHEITVAGFGAGIPENKGKVSIENGIIFMRDIEEDFDGIHWINSNTALDYIALNNDELIKGSDLPHHEPLNLIVKERLAIWQRFR